MDVTQVWGGFPAANKAVSNNIYDANVKAHADRHRSIMKKCYKKLNSYVVEGSLEEELVLDNVMALLECLRDSNVTIRWFMLHNNARNPVYREAIQNAMDREGLIEFLFKLAQFEQLFSALIRQLVSDKAALWAEDRDTAVESLTEISLYFKGERSWDKGEPDESYADWFEDIAN